MTRLALLLLSLCLAAPCWAGIDLNTSDDTVQCGSDSSVDSLTTFTYLAHFNADTLGGENALIYKMNGTDGVFFGVNSTQIYCGVDKVTTDSFAGSSTAIIATGTWYWAACTITASGQPSIYTGTTTLTEVTYAAGRTAGAGAEVDESAGQLTVGSRVSSNPPFDGTIDTVAVWNAALTLAQLTQVAQSQQHRMALQILPGNLVVSLEFDEQPAGSNADGQTFRDRSPTGLNHCTGNDGADNIGLTMALNGPLSYP